MIIDKCDICGNWIKPSDNIFLLGERRHQVHCPDLVPVACRKSCALQGKEKIDQGEWVLPKLESKGSRLFPEVVEGGNGDGI
ncbi:hypothetical protein [Desulfosediminicola ganghwensis]|uniref:hypothetical protein n=1 Tax=Desulfosediminicola ganghwensis TaxID=2569540 RepID=UPI0010ABB9BE|nr:hypothetical protein [Desulfosediminicola ganghwensis]